MSQDAVEAARVQRLKEKGIETVIDTLTGKIVGYIALDRSAERLAETLNGPPPQLASDAER